MSRELDAVNILRNGLIDEGVVCITQKTFDKCLDIIEATLKKLEKIEQPLIKRGFDNLEDFIKQLDEYVQMSEKEHEKLMMLESQNSQNKLEALEIIKNKYIDVGWLVRSENLNQYNDCISNKDKHLTQEEYCLLKEELIK